MIEITIKIEEEERITGYLVIDSLVHGNSAGGVRMSENISLEELRVLARNMTLKYGFLGIPQGGAKGGILFNPEVSLEKRRQALSLFGRGIAPFLKTRTYIPGPDMGTDNESIRWMLLASGKKPVRRSIHSGGSGYYTGLTVFTSATRASDFLRLSLNHSRIAIEGFGKVGSAVALLFERAGAKVVAVSTIKGAIYNEKGLSISTLVKETAEKGSSFVMDYREADKISVKELLTLDVDILCPCAQHFTITEENAPYIKARIISPGANVPCTMQAEDILFSRSILSLPDFVTNCGEVLGTYLEVAGFPIKKIADLIPRLIGPKIEEFILLSQEKGIHSSALAQEWAIKRFNRLKQKVEGKGIEGKFIKPSLVRFARNFIPSWIMGRIGARYFIQSMKEPVRM